MDIEKRMQIRDYTPGVWVGLNALFGVHIMVGMASSCLEQNSRVNVLETHESKAIETSAFNLSALARRFKAEIPSKKACVDNVSTLIHGKERNSVVLVLEF